MARYLHEVQQLYNVSDRLNLLAEGVQTSHSKRVSPIISAVLIAGGIALAIAGARARGSKS